jgi:hypothetical protein
LAGAQVGRDDDERGRRGPLRGDLLGGVLGLLLAELGKRDGGEVVGPEADVGGALAVADEGGADDVLLTPL